MNDWSPRSILRWVFDSERGTSDRLLPRLIFLRALGLIYYSAFFSLISQIRGLIGPHGILPAGEHLQALAERFGHGHGNLLGRHDRLAAAGPELLAARHACDLFRVLPLLR